MAEDRGDRSDERADARPDAPSNSPAPKQRVQPSPFRDVLQVLGIELALDGNNNLWYFPSRPVRPSLLAEMRMRRLELVADQLYRAKPDNSLAPDGEPPFCCAICQGLHFVRRKGSLDTWSCSRCRPPAIPIGEVEWRTGRGDGGDRV